MTTIKNIKKIGKKSLELSKQVRGQRSTIGQDKFINKNPKNAKDDLFEELRKIKDLGPFC